MILWRNRPCSLFEGRFNVLSCSFFFNTTQILLKKIFHSLFAQTDQISTTFGNQQNRKSVNKKNSTSNNMGLYVHQ